MVDVLALGIGMPARAIGLGGRLRGRFGLLAAFPLYLAFVFGFIRDLWNPLGMRDRGFMLLFGMISALLYVLFAFASINYVTLLVAVVLLTTSGLHASSRRAHVVERACR